MPDENKVDEELEVTEAESVEEAPRRVTVAPPRPDQTHREPERKPFEAWATELGTEDWLLAAAKMHARWPAGREVTKLEFNAALKGAGDVTSR